MLLLLSLQLLICSKDFYPFAVLAIRACRPRSLDPRSRYRQDRPNRYPSHSSSHLFRLTDQLQSTWRLLAKLLSRFDRQARVLLYFAVDCPIQNAEGDKGRYLLTPEL